MNQLPKSVATAHIWWLSLVSDQSVRVKLKVDQLPDCLSFFLGRARGRTFFFLRWTTRCECLAECRSSIFINR